MNTVKKMGQNKDGIIGLVLIAVIIVIIVGVVVWAIGPGETKPVEQDKSIDTQKEPIRQEESQKLRTPDEVLDLVKHYKGKGNTGLTLSEVIAMVVLIAYPDEEILKNPSTDWGWSALPMSGDPDTDRRWNVEFYLKTYSETISYEWVVDMETKSVYAKNENGKDILDMLND